MPISPNEAEKIYNENRHLLFSQIVLEIDKLLGSGMRQYTIKGVPRDVAERIQTAYREVGWDVHEDINVRDSAGYLMFTDSRDQHGRFM